MEVFAPIDAFWTAYMIFSDWKEKKTFHCQNQGISESIVI